MKDFKNWHPKSKGELTEQVILTELLKRKVGCSKPIGDNQPYDLIIDSNYRLYKIQCRTGRITGKNKSSITFSCLSSRTNTKKTYIVDSRDKFDLFAIWTPEIEKEVFVICSKECTTNSGVFALSNNRFKQGRKASDYTLDKWLEKN